MYPHIIRKVMWGNLYELGQTKLITICMVTPYFHENENVRYRNVLPTFFAHPQNFKVIYNAYIIIWPMAIEYDLTF